MKPIEEVYPDGDYFFDYGPLIESISNVVVRVDDDDYQGDSRILFKQDGKFGVLIFGWGSCSGCDALLACGNLSEVDKLRNELSSQVKWFDSASEALLYFNTHDWEGDYCWHQEETKRFIAEATGFLRNEIDAQDLAAQAFVESSSSQRKQVERPKA